MEETFAFRLASFSLAESSRAFFSLSSASFCSMSSVAFSLALDWGLE